MQSKLKPKNQRKKFYIAAGNGWLAHFKGCFFVKGHDFVLILWTDSHNTPYESRYHNTESGRLVYMEWISNPLHNSREPHIQTEKKS